MWSALSRVLNSVAANRKAMRWKRGGNGSNDCVDLAAGRTKIRSSHQPRFRRELSAREATSAYLALPVIGLSQLITMFSAFVLFSCVFLFNFNVVKSEELAPPYFNLADNRRIYASSTCGEEINEPELYCKLVGSSASSSDDEYNIIKGQVRI